MVQTQKMTPFQIVDVLIGDPEVCHLVPDRLPVPHRIDLINLIKQHRKGGLDKLDHHLITQTPQRLLFDMKMMVAAC